MHGVDMFEAQETKSSGWRSSKEIEGFDNGQATEINLRKR